MHVSYTNSIVPLLVFSGLFYWAYLVGVIDAGRSPPIRRADNPVVFNLLLGVIAFCGIVLAATFGGWRFLLP